MRTPLSDIISVLAQSPKGVVRGLYPRASELPIKIVLPDIEYAQTSYVVSLERDHHKEAFLASILPRACTGTLTCCGPYTMYRGALMVVYAVERFGDAVIVIVNKYLGCVDVVTRHLKFSFNIDKAMEYEANSHYDFREATALDIHSTMQFYIDLAAAAPLALEDAYPATYDFLAESLIDDIYGLANARLLYCRHGEFFLEDGSTPNFIWDNGRFDYEIYGRLIRDTLHTYAESFETIIGFAAEYAVGIAHIIKDTCSYLGALHGALAKFPIKINYPIIIPACKAYKGPLVDYSTRDAAMQQSAYPRLLAKLTLKYGNDWSEKDIGRARRTYV